MQTILEGDESVELALMNRNSVLHCERVLGDTLAQQSEKNRADITGSAELNGDIAHEHQHNEYCLVNREFCSLQTFSSQYFDADQHQTSSEKLANQFNMNFDNEINNSNRNNQVVLTSRSSPRSSESMVRFNEESKIHTFLSSDPPSLVSGKNSSIEKLYSNRYLQDEALINLLDINRIILKFKNIETEKEYKKYLNEKKIHFFNKFYLLCPILMIAFYGFVFSVLSYNNNDAINRISFLTKDIKLIWFLITFFWNFILLWMSISTMCSFISICRYGLNMLTSGKTFSLLNSPLSSIVSHSNRSPEDTINVIHPVESKDNLSDDYNIIITNNNNNNHNELPEEKRTEGTEIVPRNESSPSTLLHTSTVTDGNVYHLNPLHNQTHEIQPQSHTQPQQPQQQPIDVETGVSVGTNPPSHMPAPNGPPPPPSENEMTTTHTPPGASTPGELDPVSPQTMDPLLHPAPSSSSSTPSPLTTDNSVQVVDCISRLKNFVSIVQDCTFHFKCSLLEEWVLLCLHLLCIISALFCTVDMYQVQSTEYFMESFGVPLIPVIWVWCLPLHFVLAGHCRWLMSVAMGMGSMLVCLVVLSMYIAADNKLWLSGHAIPYVLLAVFDVCWMQWLYDLHLNVSTNMLMTCTSNILLIYVRRLFTYCVIILCNIIIPIFCYSYLINCCSLFVVLSLSFFKILCVIQIFVSFSSV